MYLHALQQHAMSRPHACLPSSLCTWLSREPIPSETSTHVLQVLQASPRRWSRLEALQSGDQLMTCH